MFLKLLNNRNFFIIACLGFVAGLPLALILSTLKATLFENGFDKKKLSQIIYSDDNQRRKLEQYIHTKVRKGINDFQNKHLNEPLIFVEVPLLFETGFNSYFDYSICVYCSEESRKERRSKIQSH
jgi:dephospho-CoA kinase